MSGAQAVAMLFHIGGNIVLDTFTMAALPLICSIGSGVAASLAAPSAMAAFRGLSLAGSGAQRAGAAGMARLRGGSPANSLSRS